MKRICSLLFTLGIAALLFAESCSSSPMSEYDALVKKELNSGKRADSIFFGFYFGMSNKDFFAHCWEMNKKGLFTDGTDNMYVLHKLHNGELAHPATMNFYPDFNDNKIYCMRVLYQYDAWAPWNKNMFSDSLITDVVSSYKKMYPQGNPFMKIHDDKRGDIYIKVDGNRRITIGQQDDMIVKVDFTDLPTEQKLLNAK